jgi:hypothetical protein
LGVEWECKLLEISNIAIAARRLKPIKKRSSKNLFGK